MCEFSSESTPPPLQAHSGCIPAWHSCTCTFSRNPPYSCKRQAPGRSWMLWVALSREVHSCLWSLCNLSRSLLVPDLDVSALVYCLSDVQLQGCTLSVGSAGRCFSLQIICCVPRRYRLRCLFCREAVGMHGIFINMIRCSGEKNECLVSSGRASVNVRRSRRPFCSPSKHQALVVPALSQDPEPEQSHGLPRCGKTSPY